MTTEQDKPQRVSGSELGRILGVSHTAVAKAEARGRIKRAACDLEGKPYPPGAAAKYDPATALPEWAKNTQANMQRGEAGRGGRPPKAKPSDKPAPDEFTSAVQEMADKLSGKKDRINANNLPAGTVVVELEGQPHGGALQRNRKIEEEGGPIEDGALVDANGLPNLNRATATEKYYKALKAKLDYEEAAGKLVSIDSVAKIVEQEYSRVRARLLAIPSKLAPEVALIEDVSLCRSQIEAAVLDALAELSADQQSEQVTA